MRYYVLDINPEPWAIGDLSIHRRNGKMIPVVGRNNQLANYKEAVAELLREQNPDCISGKVRLEFYFWKRLEEGQSAETKSGRSRSQKPDVTNMQKATEDACQGVLFANDRDVSYISSILVEASTTTRGIVIIGAEVDNGLAVLDVLDEFVLARLEELNSNTEPESDLSWGDDLDVF